MTEQKFREFLSRRVVNYLYEDDGLEGIVKAWPWQDKYVLTWEECRAGDQYNEQNYTRDEVHHFASIDAVVAYLNDRGVGVTRFEL